MSYKGFLLRLVLVTEVVFAIIVWPEPLDLTALFLALLLVFSVATLGSVTFCLTFAFSFCVATILALVVYGLLAPHGLFETAWQDPLASDSQYFLHQSRYFLSDYDWSALFTTWGSLVPVFYGAFALMAFGGNYIGIVFFNCLLYTASIFLAAKLFDISKQRQRLLPLIGLLPLQGFYNSMLAKEPIYLLLIIGALYAFNHAVKARCILCWHSLLFILLTFILVIFRPTGAILLGLVALITIAKRFGFMRAALLFTVIGILTIAAVMFANFIHYDLPLFFIGSEGGVNFESNLDIPIERMVSKQIPGSLMEFFLPPWSIVVSPILGLLWMISPLPLMGELVTALLGLFSDQFSFNNFATVIRYLDSFTIAWLFLYLIRSRVSKVVMLQPLMLLGIFQVLTTVAFQFFESGRHRYLPGFILAVVVILIIGQRENIKRNRRLSNQIKY